MSRGLKITRILFISIASVFLVLVMLSYFLEDRIKTLTVRALNKNLKSEIKVGAISFSVIRNFPYASVEFKELQCIGSNVAVFKQAPLLNAKSVKLLFNFFGLFGSNYNIKKIIVSDASLNLLTGKNGENNYDIFKEDSSSGEVSFSIEKLAFENIHFYQQLMNKNFEQEIHINELESQGNFSADVFSASLHTKAMVHFISADEITYLREKEITLMSSVAINRKNATFTFNDAEAKIAQLVLNGKGEINTYAHTQMDLLFSSQNANAGELLSILPKGILPEQFKEYTFKGKVNISLTVNGVSDAKRSPAFSVKFETANTDIIPDNETYSLKNVSTQGYFTTKKSAKNPVTFLQLKNFSALLEGKPLKATIEIENFSNPLYNITAQGDASIASVLKYIAIDTLQSATGLLKIKGSFKGQAGKPESYISSGSMEVSDCNFRIKQKPVDFKNFKGSFSFNGNDVKVNTLTGLAGKSDFIITGEIKNLYAWLLQKNQSVLIDADVTANYLDLDELTLNEDKYDTASRIDFAEDIALELNIRSQKVTFKKFVAEKVAGSISLNNKVLSTNSMRFNAVDGNIYLQGSINANKSDSLLIAYEATVTKLNIQKLFFEMGNFGQTVLTDKNLRGNVTSTIQFASVWSKTLNVNIDKIFATADVIIENGELINFEPMLKLSRFVKGTDLRNVKFSTLKNNIAISNRKINVPVMEITSSALNLTGSGTHTFDNIVDYKIKMRMSELLGKKVKNLNTEFGTIEDDGMGSWHLYLSMKGPLDNPKFSYDRKSVEQNITKTIKTEKDNFLKILKEEFKNPQQKKSTEPAKKETELQLDTEEE